MIRVTICESACTVSFQPASLGSGGCGGPDKVKLTFGLEEPRLVGLPVEDLEAHQVQMNGMGIVVGLISVQISVVPSTGFSVIGASSGKHSEAT